MAFAPGGTGDGVRAQHPCITRPLTWCLEQSHAVAQEPGLALAPQRPAPFACLSEQRVTAGAHRLYNALPGLAPLDGQCVALGGRAATEDASAHG